MSNPAPAPEPIPAPIDVAKQRRRFTIMVAVDAVCLLIGVIAVVGALNFHIGWLRWVFGLAVIVGFGAQVWLIAGLAGRRQA